MKIKNIIFDFGDVFIALDKMATSRELQKLGLKEFTLEMNEINLKYEKGLISTEEFIDFYQKEFKNSTQKQLKDAWNAILLDFPLYKLEFLENNSKKYRIFLLSNTNDLHISDVKEKLGRHFYDRFTSCFEKVYYSHEIYMRKPDKEIYDFVLQENNLNPVETFFVDDTLENTNAAKQLGIQVWNINSEKDNVVNIDYHIVK
jgi:putative hydrolase of the HAD superfamily